MGRSAAGSDRCPLPSCPTNEQPEHMVELNAFYLDKYEVTVGRFRAFVDAGAPVPAFGAGAHPRLTSSGWGESGSTVWPQQVNGGGGAFAWTCGADPNVDDDVNFTATPGAFESHRMGCVNWFEAFAFCAWDGGFLPTEAEYELAAAGGEENRTYPWGNDAPNSARVFAAATSLRGPVGDFPAGAGRFGHQDLLGGVWEFALDYFNDTYPALEQRTPAQLTPPQTNTDPATATKRIVRGASAVDAFDYVALRSAARGHTDPLIRQKFFGFRCARALP